MFFGTLISIIFLKTKRKKSFILQIGTESPYFADKTSKSKKNKNCGTLIIAVANRLRNTGLETYTDNSSNILTISFYHFLILFLVL